MTDKSVLTKKRIIVGIHAVDIHSNTQDSSKQAVVLVHGIGTSSCYFLPLAYELAGQYQVIAIDLPGYGDTPKPPCALTVVELADVLIQMTHQLQLHRPVIVGHSMGCQIAARAVQKEPRVFDRLVLLAPTVNARERSLAMQALRLVQDSLCEPLQLNLIMISDYLRMGFRRYLQTSRYMLRDRIEDVIVDCPLPVLIIRGQNDPIVSADWLMTLGAVTPDVVLHEVVDASHGVQYKRAAQVAARLRDFVS